MKDKVYSLEEYKRLPLSYVDTVDPNPALQNLRVEYQWLTDHEDRLEQIKTSYI